MAAVTPPFPNLEMATSTRRPLSITENDFISRSTHTRNIHALTFTCAHHQFVCSPSTISALGQSRHLVNSPPLNAKSSENQLSSTKMSSTVTLTCFLLLSGCVVWGPLDTMWVSPLCALRALPDERWARGSTRSARCDPPLPCMHS